MSTERIEAEIAGIASRLEMLEQRQSRGQAPAVQDDVKELASLVGSLKRQVDRLQGNFEDMSEVQNDTEDLLMDLHQECKRLTKALAAYPTTKGLTKK